MNTPNNKRRRESIEKIEKAFVDLLGSRELQQISVTDICKLSGLNRSTFYANYLDVYDLADSIREKLEKEVRNLYQEEQMLGYNSNDFLKLFRHIKEHQPFYTTFFKLGYDDRYLITQYDTQLAERYFDNEHLDYHIEFFKNGFNAIVKKWLNGGCQESPEEMEQIIKSEYDRRD